MQVISLLKLATKGGGKQRRDGGLPRTRKRPSPLQLLAL